MRHHRRCATRRRRLAITCLATAMLCAWGCNSTAVDSNRWFQTGRDSEKHGDSDAAIIAYTQATQRDPSNPAGFMALGDLRRRRVEYDAAGDAYARAAALDPLNFDAHYFLAMSRHIAGRFEEARRAYLQALTIRPDHAESNVNLAAVYVQLGKPDEAEPFARRATELEPGHPGAWANLAAASPADMKKSEAAYRIAAKLTPDAQPIRIALVETHIAAEDYDGAAAALRDILREKPSANAHERLGLCLFKTRRYPEALASFREALHLDPQNIAALNGTGVTLLALYIGAGRTEPRTRDAALDALRASLAHNPNQPRIADMVARYSRM